MVLCVQGFKRVVKIVEVQIPQLLHAQMKMKIWNVILQNWIVAILDVSRSLLQIS